MSNNGIVNIHGKDYMTVARRVELAHEGNKDSLTIMTELVPADGAIVFKATVNTAKGVFTGYSAVNLDTAKLIEKNNPYEVAETSAVGRALGFAGYGIVEGIASADEMVKATRVEQGKPARVVENIEVSEVNKAMDEAIAETQYTCSTCGAAAELRSGVTKSGKAYKGIFCSTREKSHATWL